MKGYIMTDIIIADNYFGSNRNLTAKESVTRHIIADNYFGSNHNAKRSIHSGANIIILRQNATAYSVGF